MKTKSLILLFTLLAILISVNTVAQEFKSDTKLTKKEKKEARQAQLYANYKALDTLLERKQYVLEADYLQGKYGSEVPVTSNLNFIRVDPKGVVLQTGAYSGFGYNGVGGITAEGNLAKYRVFRDDKRLNYVVYITTTTNIGTYDVVLRVSSDGTARATITGLTNGSLTYRGNLVASYNSRVYKGQKTL